jgi:hypothetical protein
MDLCGTLTGMHGKLEICAKIYFKFEKQKNWEVCYVSTLNSNRKYV